MAESSDDDVPMEDLQDAEPTGKFEIKAIQLTSGSIYAVYFNFLIMIFCIRSCSFYIRLSNYDRHEPLLDEVQESEQAGAAVEESKALKQISFPEMDSDALPSAFCIKVLTSIGKWQMKMHDLSTSLDKGNPSMTAFPTCSIIKYSRDFHISLGFVIF